MKHKIRTKTKHTKNKSRRGHGFLSVVLSGLCDELIARPEDSYRLWCVVFDQETSCYEEAIARVGLPSQREK
jgi:hypothetical protein